MIRRAILSDLPADASDLLRKGVEAGAFCGEDADGPICFWGLIPDSILGESAFIWFHPIRDLRPYRLRFLRANRRFIAEALDTYPMLWATVRCDFEASQKWLRWLGFEKRGEISVDNIPLDYVELRA